MSQTPSAIVIAGGKSIRLGVDKRRLRIGTNRPLIEDVIAKLVELTDDVVIVANDPETFEGLSCRVVPDVAPGTGPLGGLLAGLDAIQAERAYVVACDLPFLSPSVLRLLNSFDGDAVVPRRASGRVETLHAIYERSCIPSARRRLRDGHLKLAELLSDLDVVSYVDEARIRGVDPDLLTFFNVNTMDDVRSAERIARERAGQAE